MQEILKDRLFYEVSGGGVTFSGGECMLNIDMLKALLCECKNHNIHTAIDTAGAVEFERFEEILPLTDLFLYDIKIFDSDKHKLYTGIDNLQILDNLRRLLELCAPVTVRIPVISGVNDTADEMREIKRFIDSHGRALSVELMPYHSMGEHKYMALGRNPNHFCAPSDEHMSLLRNIFKSNDRSN